jgi:transposase-like protein
VVERILSNWVKLHRAGKLKGFIEKSAVTAEQMEISRLLAELARAPMERDILGSATAFFRKRPGAKFAVIQRRKRICPIGVQCPCSAQAYPDITNTWRGAGG